VLFVVFFATSTNALSLTSEEVKGRIEKTLETAKKALVADPSGLESQRILNDSRLIIDTIQPYFYQVPGALHEHSPLRQIRVEEVEGWLAQYEPFFVRLIGTLQDPNADSNSVVSLVKFTKPTDQIKEALLQVARSQTARPDNAAAAYNGIFYLELDDPEIRQEVVDTLAWMNEPHSKSVLAVKIRNMAADQWATTEMLRYWKRSLEVSYLPENYPEKGGRAKLEAQYLWAAIALSHFGKLDNGLAELVRRRAEEIKLVGGHQGTIDKLIFAAEVLEGYRPPEIAVNWKGQLLGASKNAVNQDVFGGAGGNAAGKASEPIRVPALQSKSLDSSKANSGHASSKKFHLAGWIALIVGFTVILLFSKGKFKS
jgi:hypothetical protein